TASAPTPEPFLTARSNVSLDMEALRAASTAMRRRALLDGSPPPRRAATVISLTSLPNSLPLASAARALPLAFHCAPMGGLSSKKNKKCRAQGRHRINQGVLYTCGIGHGAFSANFFCHRFALALMQHPY